jgi:hypothetical protein
MDEQRREVVAAISQKRRCGGSHNLRKQSLKV